MPGCVVHLLIAGRMLETDPPYGKDAREAFRLGSLAPDMGYFPGGEALTSDLSHYLTSATLTRNIFSLACDDVRRQFARGWATHLLADALIHPLINRAAGELARSPILRTFADDPVAHIRVEQGLDAAVAGRLTRPPPPRVPIAKQRLLTALLAEAYLLTYGVGPPCLRLASSFRAMIRFCPWLLTYGRVLGWRLQLTPATDHPGVAAVAGFELVRMVSWLARRTALFGLAHPLAPAEWLLAETTRLIATFPERFAAFETAGFANLPEFNLDTGDVEPVQPTYPLTIRTLESLRQRKMTL